ncbi:MAG: TetR/AcrR family transcriptional regulator, partial [Clostridia bacterium]
MKNSTDLRVIKTKNALTQAMVQCLKEKTFDEITVQDICNKAMTRRSTFYTHFADKYELFAFTVREIYCQFPSFKQLEKVETIKEVYDFLLKDVVNFLVDNIKIVKLMQENKTNMMLLDIIAKEVMKAFLPILEKEESLS